MQKKADLNSVLVHEAGHSPLLAAYFEINHLKQLYRQGWLRRGLPHDQCESVAEHVFGVAILAWFCAAELPDPAQREKILRMALAHDLGEVYAGDITPADGVDPSEKHAREREAVLRIAEKLPGGPALVDLWEEYELGESLEARLVRQLDRLEMGLQAVAYERQGLGNLEEFIRSARVAQEDSALAALMDEARILRPQRQ